MGVLHSKLLALRRRRVVLRRAMWVERTRLPDGTWRYDVCSVDTPWRVDRDATVLLQYLAGWRPDTPNVPGWIDEIFVRRGMVAHVSTLDLAEEEARRAKAARSLSTNFGSMPMVNSSDSETT